MGGVACVVGAGFREATGKPSCTPLAGLVMGLSSEASGTSKFMLLLAMSVYTREVTCDVPWPHTDGEDDDQALPLQVHFTPSMLRISGLPRHAVYDIISAVDRQGAQSGRRPGYDMPDCSPLFDVGPTSFQLVTPVGALTVMRGPHLNAFGLYGAWSHGRFQSDETGGASSADDDVYCLHYTDAGEALFHVFMSTSACVRPLELGSDEWRALMSCKPVGPPISTNFSAAVSAIYNGAGAGVVDLVSDAGGGVDRRRAAQHDASDGDDANDGGEDDEEDTDPASLPLSASEVAAAAVAGATAADEDSADPASPLLFADEAAAAAAVGTDAAPADATATCAPTAFEPAGGVPHGADLREQTHQQRLAKAQQMPPPAEPATGAVVV